MNLLIDIFCRWALYPPGRVPVGVTVHVNEEDGDVNIETPTSLQVFFQPFFTLMDILLWLFYVLPMVY